MKFTCDRKELKEKLDLVSKVIPARSPKESLSSILINTEPPDKMSLYGTDINMSLNVSFTGCEVDEKVSFLVPAKLLKDIIDNLSSDIIGNLDEKLLTITSGSTTYHLSTQGLDDYPPPDIDWQRSDNAISIDFRLFKNSIKTVIPFTDKSNYRPALSGVLFDLRENELRIVSTDGNRLAVQKVIKNNIKFLNDQFVTNLILPTLSLSILAESESEGDIIIRFDDSKVRFDTTDFSIVTSIIDGNFPKYETVIPNKFVARATVDKNSLKDSVKRIMPICRGNGGVVSISVRKDKLILGSKSPTGIVSDEISAHTDNKEIDIMFDANYINDFLSVGTGPVNIEPSGEESPVKFTFTNNQEFIHIAMPIGEE